MPEKLEEETGGSTIKLSLRLEESKLGGKEVRPIRIYLKAMTRQLQLH